MKKTIILIGATSLVSYTIGYLIGKTEVIVNAAEVLIDIFGEYIEERSNKPYPKDLHPHYEDYKVYKKGERR